MKYLKKFESNNILNDEEFYDLMQIYRFSNYSIGNQRLVVDAFENVKKFINEHFIAKDVEKVKKWLLEQEAKKYNL